VRARPSRRLLGLFQPGAAAPDEVLLRFAVEAVIKESLELRVPLHLTVVASTSRAEAATSVQALALSERRARTVADLIRRYLPQLTPDAIDLLPLGWDGFSSPAEKRHRALIVRGGFPAEGVPMVFVGPNVAGPVRDALEAQLHAALEMAAQSGPQYVMDAGGVSFSVGGKDGYIPRGALDGDEEKKSNSAQKLLAPFFDALRDGCQFPETL
jgi:hypothetical protein